VVFWTNSALALERLAVDFDQVIQNNFLGVNAVYHAFTFMPESVEEGMSPDLRQIEFSRLEASGIHIVRTFYRPDWAMGAEAWSTPDWDSVKMKALYAWLAETRRQGIQVALNMGWWFPRDVIWNRDQHLPSYPADIKRYTAWVSESIHQIVQVRGFDNVKYLFMFTEPGGSYGDLPAGKKLWDYYIEVMRATHERLKRDGRRGLVKLVGPNTTRGPRWIANSAKSLNGILDIYASHDYNFRDYGAWYKLATKIKEAAKSSGKPFWVDEYGVQDSKLRDSPEYGNIIAQANAAFLNAGAQSSLLWVFCDQYYPYPLKYITNGDAFLDGKHSWGLFPWLAESRRVRPAWFAFTMLSNYLGGEGARIYKTQGTEDVHIAATGDREGGYAILVVNGRAQERDIVLELSRLLKGKIHRYSYRPQGKPLRGHRVMPQRIMRRIVDRLGPKEVVVYSSRPPVGTGQGSALKTLGPEDPPLNLAYRKKVEIDGRGKGTANLTNGSRLTIYKAEGGSGATQIVIDLERVYPVSRLDIYPQSVKRAKSTNIPQEITISLAGDKGSWREIPHPESHTAGSFGLRSYSFQPREARFVRLEIKQPAALAEIKVYAER